ncbi:MAG TPA: hypothetical protein VEH27_03775 [Methylomirabilota bacterium]|nr:hypothetical protein [Methylomirabilota bacterium]
MSLINDALKRASASMKKTPPPVPGASLEPVPDEPRKGKGGVVVILALLLAGTAAYGVWTMMKGEPVEVSAKSSTAEKSKPTTPAANAAAKSPEASASTPAKPDNTVKAAAAVEQPKADNTKGLPGALNKAVVVATKVQANNNEGAAVAEKIQPTAVAASASATFPEVSLQGIYYRLSKPSARISGKTLYVGDQISGATVKSIKRQSVTLEFQGQSKEVQLAR